MKFQSLNFDAGETAYFARELEAVKSASYDIKFPELMAFSIFPISSDTPEGAQSITYNQYESTGKARIISNYADDLPTANIMGKQFISAVKSVGISYQYSQDDLRASLMTGKGLPQRIADAARLGNDQKVNDLAFFGDDDYNIFGLFNNPNIPSASVANDGVGPSTLWSTKTPDQIIRDMNDLVNGIRVLTKDVERANTLLLPISQYAFISSTPRSSTSDTTILDFFKRANEDIKDVIAIEQCAGAGPLGVDVMVAYNRNPGKLTLEIPMPYKQYNPQERNLNLYIPCESKFGGLLTYYPLSMSIGEGI